MIWPPLGKDPSRAGGGKEVEEGERNKIKAEEEKKVGHAFKLQ